MPNGWVPQVKKIAVVRANAIGDFIFSLPALQALRGSYPGAEIVLLGTRLHTELVRGRPGPIDRMIEIPPVRGVSLPDQADDQANRVALDTFFQQMRAEQFDLAIQIHGGGGYSNEFTRQLGARLTVGLRAETAPKMDRWVPYVYYQHEIHRLLEVVALVGASTSDFVPHLTVTPADVDESTRVLPSTEEPLIAFHIGAGDARRRWAPAKFATVGDALAREGAQILLVGTQRERSEIDQVLAMMAYPAVDLCGKLSLGGLAGLFSRCALVISNDSGPLHIAQAVGTPTVGIYWCGNLINAGPLTRTWHRPAVSWRLICPVCATNAIYERCEHAVSFVDDVSVDEVERSARLLLHMRNEAGIRSPRWKPL